jgi:hypothetical protein
MATTKTSQLPEGFTSPFRRVAMEPDARIDDGLCCVAMITNQPLNEIKHLAVQMGLPEHGPAWVYPDLLRKLLHQFDLIASDEKEATNIDLLSDVAMIQAQFDSTTEIGRWVLWHHVRGTDKFPSFHYVVDPVYWIDPSLHVTTDFKHLLVPKQPIYYLEVCVGGPVPYCRRSSLANRELACLTIGQISNRAKSPRL